MFYTLRVASPGTGGQPRSLPDRFWLMVMVKWVDKEAVWGVHVWWLWTRVDSDTYLLLMAPGLSQVAQGLRKGRISQATTGPSLYAQLE